LNGKNGWLAWRWIFLIEGVMPIVFGLLLFVFLPSTPEKARFGFSQADKDLAVKRSRRAHNPEDAKLRPQKILPVLLNPVFWFLNFIFGAYHYCNSPITNFIQQIVQARSPFIYIGSIWQV
jgi:MFS family permease